MIKKTNNGKWLVDIRVGSRKVRIRKTFKTQSEAFRYRNFIFSESSLNKPWNPSPKDRRHLSELIQLWHATHGKHLRNNKKTLSILNSVCDFLNDPTAADLQASDFLNYRQQKEASPKTLNNHLGYINAVFNELIRTDQIQYENPFLKIRPIKISQPETSYLELDQIQELLTVMKNSRNPDVYLCSLLCLDTGARWGEVERLTLDRVKNGAVVYTETKSKKNRAVKIRPDLENQLFEHAKKLGRAGRLFNNCMTAFNRCTTRLSFQLPERQATHILRHTFASWYIINGGRITDLQKILGHSSIVVTMRYAHLSADHADSAPLYSPMSKITLT